MKKIELHLHLDGSCDIDYASQLLGKDVRDKLVVDNANSLSEYLEKFELPISLLQDLDNIENFSYLLAKALEKDEVIYAEVRFCPLFHTKKHTVDDVVDSIIKGFKRVPTVKINLIFCMMRHFSFDENMQIINLTKKFLGSGVVGIDLAGDEANYKTETFRNLFDVIRRENIPFTIHAGEADSYKSVLSAIEFGANRIGHGIRSIESYDVINKLISNNITLEVCPTSNIDTKAVNSIINHPIKALVDMGVLVTINTDNRTVSNTNLCKEYELLRENFGFTDEDFLKFNLNAIECAFISEEEKQELRNKLLS